jgi:hypothetical protein
MEICHLFEKTDSTIVVEMGKMEDDDDPENATGPIIEVKGEGVVHIVHVADTVDARSSF